MYSYKNIKSVELEISTFCNAACPQCPRNIQGGKTISNLPMINWTLEQLQSIFKIEFVKQLEMVYFCGTYGDPMTNNYIVEMCQWFKTINPKIKLGIHTNGGVGRTDTYKQLATCVDFIAFGIDGLEDTNHLYRKNVIWSQVLKNAQAFIEQGGHAVWDFIVFRHNQHQVDQAKQFSQDFGFKEFNVKKTGRFFNKAHQLVDKVDVLATDGSFEYIIEPPTDKNYLNNAYDHLSQVDFKDYVRETKITCYWRKNHMIYIGADGHVFPCGFLHDRLYGQEAESTVDHKKILDWMDDIGGADLSNAFSTDLADIIEGKWFKKIQSSWHDDRLERCGLLCGDRINLLSPQNSTIKYKKDLISKDPK